ncbi:MAG: hypothetical protein PHF86_06005 [Candidatus Nanoarchaeia archaeon]|nr:hypothetical protein [Candidatus Nanoarchaeia archaeon]
MANNIIKYTGLKSLNLMDQTKLKNVFEMEYEKIRRMYGNDMDLSITVKTDSEEKKKYSINAKIDGPSKIITAEATDRDITAVSREIVKKLKNELQKKYKEDGKHWKGIKGVIQRFIR